MISEITLDQYLEIKEDIDVGFAIFLTDDEYTDICAEHNWYFSSNMEFYVIRMSVEEFLQMDFNTHPKTLVIKNGKEIKNINGLPTEEAFEEIYVVITD